MPLQKVAYSLHLAANVALLFLVDVQHLEQASLILNYNFEIWRSLNMESWDDAPNIQLRKKRVKNRLPTTC